jgi:hypothetical protein
MATCRSFVGIFSSVAWARGLCLWRRRAGRAGRPRLKAMPRGEVIQFQKQRNIFFLKITEIHS